MRFLSFSAAFCGFFFSLTSFATLHEPTAQVRSTFSRTHDYKEFADEKTPAIVFVFLSTKCPLVQQYAPTLRKLWEEYRGAGIQFVGVYVSKGESLPQIALHAQKRKIPFRIVLDSDQELVRLYKVERSTEVVVVHPKEKDNGRLRPLYQGMIDDEFQIAGRKPMPLRTPLRDALNAIVRKEAIQVTKTLADGCLIQQGGFKPKEGITFYEHIAPIFQAKCQTCHRPGGGAPMSLIDYDDAATYSSMIAEMVQDRRMPPWPGHSSMKFVDDKRMTQEEVDLVKSWDATGAEEGKKVSAPKPIEWPDPKAWKIGRPDMVVKTKPYAVPATGYIPYVYHLIPTNFKEDRFLQAVEVRTDTPGVVHHIQVLEGKPDPTVTDVKGPVPLDPVGQIKLHGFSMEESRLVANYVPGNNDNAVTYAPNKGFRVRKGAILFVETHYTTNGTAATETAEVGLIFRKDPPPVEFHTQWFYRTRGHFKIRAGDEHHEMVKEDIYIPKKDVRIIAVRPHLHSRGKDILIEKVTRKAGAETRDFVLSIPVWDFNWQRNYYFAGPEGKSPLYLLGGERLEMTAHWDNSRFNPSNPDPKQDTFWGAQTKDEMMALLVTYEELTKEESASLRALKENK